MGEEREKRREGRKISRTDDWQRWAQLWQMWLTSHLKLTLRVGRAVVPLHESKRKKCFKYYTSLKKSLKVATTSPPHSLTKHFKKSFMWAMELPLPSDIKINRNVDVKVLKWAILLLWLKTMNFVFPYLILFLDVSSVYSLAFFFFCNKEEFL